MSSKPSSPTIGFSEDNFDQEHEDNVDSSQISATPIGDNLPSSDTLNAKPVSLTLDALNSETDHDTQSDPPQPLSLDFSHLHAADVTSLNGSQSPTLTPTLQIPPQTSSEEDAPPESTSKDESLIFVFEGEDEQRRQLGSSADSTEKDGFNGRDVRSGSIDETVICESGIQDEKSNGKSDQRICEDLHLSKSDQSKVESIFHDADEQRIISGQTEMLSGPQSNASSPSHLIVDMESSSSESEGASQSPYPIYLSDSSTGSSSPFNIEFEASDKSENTVGSETSLSSSSSDAEGCSVIGSNSQYKHILLETSNADHTFPNMSDSSVGLAEPILFPNNPSNPTSLENQTATIENLAIVEPPVSQTSEQWNAAIPDEKDSEDSIDKASDNEETLDFDTVRCENSLQSEFSSYETIFPPGRHDPLEIDTADARVECSHDSDQANESLDQNQNIPGGTACVDFGSVTKGAEFNQNDAKLITVPHKDSPTSTVYEPTDHDTVPIDSPLLDKPLFDASHTLLHSPGLSSLNTPNDDSSLPMQLARAKEFIHHLRLSRDAMHSSIDTLKTLVQNERAVTRVTKRQLAIANETIQSSPSHSLQAEIDDLKSRLVNTNSQLKCAEQRTYSLSTEVRSLQTKLESKDAECNRLHDVKRSLTSENRASSAKISNLFSQIEQCEQERCTLATRLLDESSKASHSICEAENLRLKVQSLESIIMEHSEQLDRVRFLEKEICVRDENNVVLKKAISTVSNEKNSKILALTDELEKARARISDMEVALSENEAYKVRNKDLEREITMKNEVISIQQKTSLKRVSIVTFSKEEMRKKLLEVNIARAVIAAKDNHLAEMRKAVVEAESHTKDELLKQAALEGRCSELNCKLISLENELADTRRKLSLSEALRPDTNSKRSGLDQSFSKLTSSCSKASDAEVCSSGQFFHSELEHAHTPSDTIGQQDPETSGNINEDNPPFGENSSVSLSSDLSDDQATTENCGSSPLHSLADLEAASNTSPCDGASSCFTEASSNHPDANGKLVHSPGCNGEIPVRTDDTKDNPHDTLTRMTSLENTLEKLELERDSKIRECKALESYIQEKMNPALEEAHERFEKKMTECRELQNGFDVYKERSEQLQDKLTKDFHQSTERLNETLLALEDTKGLLTRSKSEIAMYADKVAELISEKEECSKTIENLQQDSEHFRKALVILREQLLTTEGSVSDSQQQASDLKLQVEHLSRIVSEEQSRRNTAEQRAARKDGLLFDLERKHDELVRKNSALIADAQNTSLRLNELQKHTDDLEKAFEITSNALHDQSEKARSRNEESIRSCLDLNKTLALRENEILELRKELTHVKKLAAGLSDSLVSATKRLKSAEDDSSRLKQRIVDTDAKDKQKNERIRLLEHNLVVANTASERLRAEVVSNDENLTNLKSDLAEKEQRVEVLQVEKQRLERDFHDLRVQLSTNYSKREFLEIQVAALKGDIAAKDANFREVDKSLKRHTSEAEVMREKLRDLETSASNTSLSLEKQKHEKARTEATVRQLEIDLKGKEKELKELKSHIENQEIALNECRMKEKLLITNIDELRLENAQKLDAESRLQDLTIKLKKTEEGLNERDCNIESLRSEIEKSKDLLVERDARSAFEASQRSKSEEIMKPSRYLEETLEARNVEIQSLLAKNQEAEDRNRILVSQAIESSNHLQQMRNQLSTSESELTRVREEESKLKEKIRNLSSSLEERECDIAKMTKKLSNVEASCSRACNKCERAQENGEIFISRKLFEQKMAAVSKLRDWCRHLKKKLIDSENTLYERESNVEALHEIVGRLDERIQKLKDNLREKNSKIRRMESAHIVNKTHLESRIRSLRSALEEVEQDCMPSRNTDPHPDEKSTGDIIDEMGQLKVQLRLREMDVNEARSRNQALESCISNYERDVVRAERKIEELKAELEIFGSVAARNEWMTLQKESNGKFVAEDVLLLELQRVKSELQASQEESKAWRSKTDVWESTEDIELQPTTSSLGNALRASDGDLSKQIDAKKNATLTAESKRTNSARNPEVTSGHVTFCTVTFKLRVPRARLGIETNIYILGDDLSLGQWNAEKKISMFVSQEDGNGVFRKCQVVLPATLTTRYKYLADAGNGILHWEHGSDRELRLDGHSTCEVTDEWRDKN